MIALIGLVVVIASVVGGFTIAGGKLIALFQLSELIVILGTATGTVLIATPPAVLKSLAEKLPKLAADIGRWIGRARAMALTSSATTTKS